jgi:hypothetical protein
LLVRAPRFLSELDVLLLTAFGTASEQKDESVAISAEIDSEARTVIDLQFRYAQTDAFYIRKVTQTQAPERHNNAGSG